MMDVQHLAVSEGSIIMVADKDHCSLKSCGVPVSKRGNLSAREGERSWNLIQRRVNNFKSMIVVVQSSSRVPLFTTLWATACQASLSITNSRILPKFMSIELVMPSNHLTLCHPLLLLPSIFPRIRVFSNESAVHIRWPKYWSFNYSISPSKVYSGLISFRIDCFDLLAVQGTLKSLLQHHNLKASILWCSTFFTAQLSHLYMTAGKAIVI